MSSIDLTPSRRRRVMKPAHRNVKLQRDCSFKISRVGRIQHRVTHLFSCTFSTTTSNAASALHGSNSNTQVQDINSPLIQEDGDNKVLKLRFDVSQYAPEEIMVKTVDNKLLVHAKHEEKSDTKSVYREYNREFLLPKGCNPELIKSSLSKDGVLTVDAPLPLQALTAGETMIPIGHH
ncbi:heat shock protein beta-1 [Uranotaenia lowii]|uniref:heat shock protein beta-1 n=1 Tax=Uranotaenia lowii TaxID=190385 RepID=UPI00247A11F7|nr:heat shock protein beta-1 [Uranotaenia lowii]